MAGNSLPARQQVEDFRSALAARSRAAVNQTASVMLTARLDLGAQWAAVAQALKHNGEFGLAYQALQLLLEQTNRDPQGVIQTALLLARFGRHATAREMLDTLPLEHTRTTEIAYFSACAIPPPFLWLTFGDWDNGGWLLGGRTPSRDVAVAGVSATGR